jgi:hypothetical protein
MRLSFLTIILSFCTFAFAQTQGTLTLNFTQTPHTSYTGSKNVMAVWVQTNSGTFVKTRKRNVGNGTKDHLPIWAVNSGGSVNNATSSACNTVGATTGATLNNFGAISVTWDGTDVSGNLVADGTYKITIESTWNHGNTNTTTRTFTFTKGPNADVQWPNDDSNFTGIILSWQPSGAGVAEVASPLLVQISPNPSSSGQVEVSFNEATSITVYNMAGAEILVVPVLNEQKKTLNLSAVPNGIYFVEVSNGKTSVKEKIVINK